MDYIVRGNRVIIVDLQRLASIPKIDPEELSDAMDMRNFDIGSYMRGKDIDPLQVASYSVACSRHPQGEIISCLKDGLGNPYVPGSSLKGALRTAILWERIKKDSSLMNEARNKIVSAIERAGPRSSAAWAAQPLERLFLGRDPVKGNHPNYDHLRALKVSDSDIIPKEQLQCFDAAVRNLRGDRLETKMTLCVEAFQPGTKTQISLDLDPFLLRDDIQSKLNLKVDDLKDLEKISRSYYSDYIKSEIDFFSEYDEPVLSNFYNKLQALNERKDGMLLRAGWGSGWHGMTVARLFPDLLDDIRDAFRLGRMNVAEFPKTRKLALMENDPKYKMQPFGWIWARSFQK
jgi:CRISPR-associated protein Csm5